MEYRVLIAVNCSNYSAMPVLMPKINALIKRYKGLLVKKREKVIINKVHKK